MPSAVTAITKQRNPLAEAAETPEGIFEQLLDRSPDTAGWFPIDAIETALSRALAALDNMAPRGAAAPGVGESEGHLPAETVFYMAGGAAADIKQAKLLIQIGYQSYLQSLHQEGA